MILDKLILKRGTSDKCATYAGTVGEIVYDSTNSLVRVYTKNTTSSGGKYIATYDDVPVIGSLSELSSLEDAPALQEDPTDLFNATLNS